jgi:hypothetical protein
MIADFVDQQDQDQTEFNRVKGVNRRQDELLKQITDLNQTQDQEIDNLEGEEARLQQNVKQIQAANAALAQKLAAMSQRRARAEPVTQPEPQPVVGVSVATDKVPADVTPATTPAIDPRARQYAQALRRQLNQLQTMVALKAPEDQSQLKQDIDALKSQLAKLQQSEPVATATPATVGGQSADIMPARASSDDEADDGVIDLTGVDDVLAQFRKPAKKSAKKKSKEKEPEFELTEENKIPLKKVFAGYTISFDPATKTVSAFRGLSGPQQGKSVKINNATPGAYLRAVRHLLGDEVAEGSVFGQQKFGTQIDLAKLKSKLEKTKPAQSAPTEPQLVAYQSPERLSDLQLRKQRVDDLAGIKQTIEQLQARATRGGRELPRGLAADLEDYFTVKDVDTAYDDMMSKYQRQLAALQQYLGMRKVLWSPKKDVHENKSSEAYEQGGRAGYYGRAYNNPYESGTDDYADYKRGYRDFRDEGKDYGVEKKKQSPSIDRDRDFLEAQDQSQSNDEVMKRLFKDFGDIFGKQPPNPKSQEPEKKEVKEMGRAGYNAMQTEKDWFEVERYLSKLINDRTLDSETRAEARQRYLEKRKEAQQKGWAK